MHFMICWSAIHAVMLKSVDVRVDVTTINLIRTYAMYHCHRPSALYERRLITASLLLLLQCVVVAGR